MKARKFLSVSCTPQTLYDGLRRKQEQQRQVEKEIEALRLAIALLADDDKNSCGVAAPAGDGCKTLAAAILGASSIQTRRPAAE